jgi:DNA polymerase III alpha subunit
MPMRSARSGFRAATALWAVRALQRAGDKDDLPLFRRVAMPEMEPDADLPPMPPGEQVVEDYRHLHLSLKAHPVSFLRADLARAASCGTNCCRRSRTARASPSRGWCWCASGRAPPRA